MAKLRPPLLLTQNASRFKSWAMDRCRSSNYSRKQRRRGLPNVPSNGRRKAWASLPNAEATVLAELGIGNCSTTIKMSLKPVLHRTPTARLAFYGEVGHNHGQP